MRLRSVELRVPRAAHAAEFLENLWGLVPAGRGGATWFFRGTGDHPYIFAVTDALEPGVSAITFAGAADEVDQVQSRARVAGVPLDSVAAFDVPGGGAGIEARGPEGQVYRLVVEGDRPARLEGRDRPVQITHAVLNTVDVANAERFAVDVLGFRVSDRTRHMTFVRCNRKHHAIAYAHSEVPSLNHVAFEMQDLDAVMRGLGRMRDAGIEPVWGPGRHGPGNNVFSYFIAPFGAIVEYTAEVSEVGDDYKVGGPDDWKWPAGRIDHWGVSTKDVARTSVAERVYRFAR
jgi:catechol 2,3-dioxygenase-like lactoylglutathione lyase family enzyme